ncbi:nucleotide exchange factor GrpE [Clostridium sp.]|uniref:nucleotide exchange factor GrpE n=1 Tax=Clostridium sp. TaxID=1506 RepID=UPI002610718D|nr:nucleotide exchange factor GrpE [Clostridium sp.]
MLDIMDELKNYKPVEFKENLHEDEDNETEELRSILNVFTKSYERISKEQYKTSNAIDEVLDVLEENNEINNEMQAVIKDLKEQSADKENELKVMLNTIISMSDTFDYMSNYVLNSDNENLKVQFKLVQEQLVEKLAKASILVLGIVNGKVDINIHQPIGTKWQEDKPEDTVLEIVRKGYMYKGKLLRKAEVVINKF